MDVREAIYAVSGCVVFVFVILLCGERFPALLKQVGNSKGVRRLITDQISDMLTRLRNAAMVGHDQVSMPTAKTKVAIAEILKQEGFIRNYNVDESGTVGVLHIGLKYSANDESVILGIKRISSPGCRVYVRAKEIPRVLNGLGMAILSTPQGVLVDRECKRANVGGEVLCYIW